MFKFLAGTAFAALLVGVFAYAVLPSAQDAVDGATARVMATMVPAAGEVAAQVADIAQRDVVLVPHKAIYDFKMQGISSGSGAISDIRGRMFYEQADACDGWTTDHRFTSEYFYPERPAVHNVSQYSAWEAKDGSLFRFNSERQEDNTPGEQLRGGIERNADGATVAQYSRPPELSFDLPADYYLPVSHTTEMIRRARKGDKIFNAVLFDGTDADGPVEVNAVITRELTADEHAAIAKQLNTDAGKDGAADLLGARAWRIRMAVFTLHPKEGVDNTTPSYEMDMVLHDNGVISDAVVDYQQFKVAQKLSALEALPAAGCN